MQNGMEQRGKKFLAFNILWVFLFVLLTVNFFHTEKNPENCGCCPACHFQESSLSLTPSLPVQLPALLLVETLSCLDSSVNAVVFVSDRVSRSPPLS
jgi:hypothetical protein